jgi:uncharacterized protein (DUF885 family)
VSSAAGRSARRILRLVCGSGFLAGFFGLPSAATGQTASKPFDQILDRVWQWRLDRNPQLRIQHGLRVEHLRSETPAAAAQSADFARSILTALDRLSPQELTADQDITARAVRFEMERVVEAPRYYWHFFTVTPYQSGFLASETYPVFTSFVFTTPEDAERYLGLVRELADLIDQKLVKLRGQATRGIRLPQPAIPAVVKLYSDYATSVPKVLAVSADRLARLAPADQDRFHARLGESIEQRLVPAYRAIASYLDADYARQAPRAVGLGRYPGGQAAYRYAIRRSTTLDLSPDSVYRLGLKRMGELRVKMAAVRRQVGFEGDQAAFHRSLKADPRFIAPSAEALEANYRKCLAKLEPFVPKLFRFLPKASYAVKRLAPEAERGMTFGYYDQPETVGDTGYYVYNGSNLAAKPTFTNCAMIYHELVPGHHFHVASQQENEGLHPVERSNMSFGAYNEGWGEYAASLGYELGIYDDPFALYGRYLQESHVTARLVLDPGLNQFGWSIDRAERYLREATLLSDREIESEVLRYSTDLPAQALGYGIGYETIWSLRRRAERALGSRFDLRDFHDVVLGHGAMPLAVLQVKVDRYIRSKGGAAPVH